MPKVPEIPNRQIKTIYNPKDAIAKASMKQQAYILSLCERRKLPVPDLAKLTTGEAAQLISNMTNAGEPLAYKGIHPFKCAKCQYIAKGKIDFKEHYETEHWD